MSFKQSIVSFALIMALGVGGYSLVQKGIYPVAIVHLSVVTARQVAQDSRVAYTYFQNVLRSSGNDPSALDTPESQLEIKRATLERLIFDKIIYRELDLRVKEDFTEIANKNIDQYISSNQNVEEGARLLYGLELPDFRDRILLPQAYREILEGRMFLGNQQFGDWLKNSGTNVRVFILSPGMQWIDGSVKINSEGE